MRRNLNRIRLDKIAAVDRPCQEHATVAIIKRAPEIDTSPLGIAKATFQEALEGNMIAGAVNEAFYQSFNGLWERNDAFRTALTDELAEGGDGSTASAAYVASVKALVDEAVAEARNAGATAADTTPVEKALTAAAEGWLESKRKDGLMKISTKAELQSAISKFAVATATLADVAAIQKAAEDLKAEDLLPADGPLAKAKPDPEIATMKRELAILKLAPEARTHFDGLDETGQTAFLAKSADEQAKDVEAANATDPVAYKCADGTLIRKSDGTAAALLAKRNDELAAKIGKLEGSLAGSTIEKRAVEEFPNVAKAVAVDMLSSVQQLGEDSVAGKAMLKSLQTLNSGQGRMFKSLGSEDDDGPTGDIRKIRSDFDQKVSEIAARDKISKSDATPKARVEHPDLFAKAFPETVEASEESAEAARQSADG